MTELAVHDRLCKPHARCTTVRWCCRHAVTIGFPEVTYSLGLEELTETLCLIPILICFRLAEQLCKLIAGWIFSKDLFVPAVGCSHGIKHVSLYHLVSCMVTLMYERVLLYTIFIRSNLSCKF